LSGWVPEEDFKGDKKRWTSAEEWNDRAEKVMPILKATNRKLEATASESVARIAALESAAEESRINTEKMLKVQAKVSEQAYQKAVNDLREKQKEAAKNEDWEHYDAMQDAQDKIEPPPVIELPTEPVKTPEVDPDYGRAAFNDFVSRNKWYGHEDVPGVDPAMTGYAHHLAMKYQREGVTDPDEQLKNVENDIKKKFPDYFTNDRREDQSVAEAGPGGRGGKKTDGFDKLPADAKEQYNLIKRDMPEYTKKDFMEAYNS